MSSESQNLIKWLAAEIGKQEKKVATITRQYCDIEDRMKILRKERDVKFDKREKALKVVRVLKDSLKHVQASNGIKVKEVKSIGTRATKDPELIEICPKCEYRIEECRCWAKSGTIPLGYIGEIRCIDCGFMMDACECSVNRAEEAEKHPLRRKIIIGGETIGYMDWVHGTRHLSNVRRPFRPRRVRVLRRLNPQPLYEYL